LRRKLTNKKQKRASLQGTYRSFDQLQKLYPNIALWVERAEVRHPCGETLKRAFGFIGDEKANVMESKIKLLRSQRTFSVS
jgi:hypothetical protein